MEPERPEEDDTLTAEPLLPGFPYHIRDLFP